MLITPLLNHSWRSQPGPEAADLSPRRATLCVTTAGRPDCCFSLPWPAVALREGGSPLTSHACRHPPTGIDKFDSTWNSMFVGPGMSQMFASSYVKNRFAQKPFYPCLPQGNSGQSPREKSGLAKDGSQPQKPKKTEIKCRNK